MFWGGSLSPLPDLREVGRVPAWHWYPYSCREGVEGDISTLAPPWIPGTCCTLWAAPGWDTPAQAHRMSLPTRSHGPWGDPHHLWPGAWLLSEKGHFGGDKLPRKGPGCPHRTQQWQSPLCRTGMRSWISPSPCCFFQQQITVRSPHPSPQTFLGTWVMMGLGRVLKSSLVLMRAVTV